MCSFYCLFSLPCLLVLFCKPCQLSSAAVDTMLRICDILTLSHSNEMLKKVNYHSLFCFHKDSLNMFLRHKARPGSGHHRLSTPCLIYVCSQTCSNRHDLMQLYRQELDNLHCDMEWNKLLRILSNF